MTALQPEPRPGKPSIRSGEDRCPSCNQLIPDGQSAAIHARIEAKERERNAVAQQKLRIELARQKTDLDAQTATALAAANAETEAALAAAQAELESATAAARAAGRKAAETSMKATLVRATRERDQAQRSLKALAADQDTLLTRRLQEQRASLTTAAEAKLGKERARAFQEAQRLGAKVDALRQQLDEQRTQGQHGEGAQIDLAEALREAFPSDRITRIGDGQRGANHLQEVMVDDRVCGRIVYDWNRRGAWRNGYVSRLRKDQIALDAGHAIIAMQHLPAGANQIQLVDDVIVTNPARVVVLVELLRDQIVQIDALRLSNSERAEKTSQLYQFIISDRCRKLFDEIDTSAEALLEIDVEEQNAHKAIWRRRGELTRSILKSGGALVTGVDRIIGAARAGDGA